MSKYFGAAAFIVTAGARIALGQGFYPLGVLPPEGAFSQGWGMSADGAVVAGFSNRFVGSPERAFRWTVADGIAELATDPEVHRTVAFGVSGNGNVVVGLSRSNLGVEQAFRWSSDLGFERLGTLPGGSSSCANAASQEGSVVVGYANAPSLTKAFRWTRSDGLTDLGTLPGGTFSSAWGVSSDGTVVVGASTDTTGVEQAFRWTASTGMLRLDPLPGETFAVAFGVSRAGTIIVGASGGSVPNHPTMWLADGHPVDLGLLPGHLHAFAKATSDDGSVVIGTSTAGDSSIRAFLWSANTGIVDLNEYLRAMGARLAGWQLLEAQAVSADGRVIVGTGQSPCGRREAWRAVIGSGCRADFNADGNLDPDDLSDFVTCFFAQPRCPRADFNADCSRDPDDLADFITDFFAGCR